jgi:hypothetical protein
MGPYVYAENNPINRVDPSGLRSFGGDWSRGGDDEARTYQTARIHAEVTTDDSDCQNKDCTCKGNVKFALHFHVRVSGSRFVGPASPGHTFGLCIGGTFTRFKRTNIPANMQGPDPQGYRYFYNLVADVDLPSLPCSGGDSSTLISVSNSDYCADATKGRSAEVLEVRTIVKSCGNAAATMQLTELPTGAGFPHPMRCLTCHEEPYPAWDPKQNYE